MLFINVLGCTSEIVSVENGGDKLKKILLFLPYLYRVIIATIVIRDFKHININYYFFIGIIFLLFFSYLHGMILLLLMLMFSSSSDTHQSSK